MRTIVTQMFVLTPVLVIALATPALDAVHASEGGQRGGPPVKRTNPPTLSTPTGYTHVVEVTGPVKTIYIAGQIAFDKDGKVVGAGDMKAQAEQVFKNLETALAAAGAKFSDVVKMNTYVTDMEKAPAVREVRARYFADTTPASTLVQVPRLARQELILEIEVIAVISR
jgi:2-iminobutanoate/2-iminopropanoate deaminase